MFNCIIRNTPLRPTTKNLLLFYLYTRIPKSKNKKGCFNFLKQPFI
nr:MAG TPA: hypothetical protein [Microviridae sp.]